MTTTCPYCGSVLIPGQPLCTDCGKPVPGVTGTAAPKKASGGAGPDQSRQPPRRDKRRDYSLIGKVITDKYKVLDILGQGGFGTVYLVEIMAGMVGEKLALKVLAPELGELPAFRNQFLNEIRVAMRLVDKYIVQIRDVGVSGEGLLYYTMDYCPGTTLSQVLRQEGKLAVTRGVLIALNVLRALQTAHAAGIVHRDLKPANIMVQAEGGKETVRVLDFGIATAVETSRETTKAFAGSPHYMPPEQFLGSEIGFYTDTYALGVVLYESITGQKPYPGSSPQEVFKSLKTRTPALPESYTPEITGFPGLSDLILRAIERNPERRIQSAKEFFEALNSILLRGTTIESAPPPSPPVAPPGPPPAARIAAERIRRRRSPIATRRSNSHIWAVAVATLIIGLVVVGVLFHKEILRMWAPPDQGQKTPVTGTGPTIKEKAAKTPKAEEKAAPKVTPEEKEGPSFDKAKEAAQAEMAKHFLAQAQKAVEAKDWQGAVEAVDRVLKVDAANARAHEIRGTAALGLGDFKSAEQSLDKAREALTPDAVSPGLLMALAEVKLRASPPKPSEAESLAAAALAKAAEDPSALAKAYVLLVAIYEEEGKTAEAKDLVQSAKAKKIESPEIEKLYDEYFLAAARRQKTDAQSFLTTAREAFDKGDYKEAIRLAAESRKALPTAEADELAAQSHLELKEPEKAEKILAAALARAKGEPPAGSNEEKPSPEVIARLESLLVLVSGESILSRYRSGEEKSPDLLQKAAEAFTTARESIKKLEEGRRARLTYHVDVGVATVSALQGEVDRAVESLQSYQNAQDPVVQYELASIVFTAGQKTASKEKRVKAYEFAKKGLSAASKSKALPEAMLLDSKFLTGLCNLRLGDLLGKDTLHRSALNNFAEAEEAGMKSVPLYENWGLAYARVENLIGAARCFRRAYELDPTPERCLRAVDYYSKAAPNKPDAAEILKDGKARFKDDESVQKKQIGS